MRSLHVGVIHELPLAGSGYEHEPARLVGAVSRRRLTAYDSAQAPVRQQELAPTKNIEIPVHQISNCEFNSNFATNDFLCALCVFAVK